MALHLTKVAVGLSEVDGLRARLAARVEGGLSHVTTRFRPTRADEVIGGSLFWIIKHRLVARSPIHGFGEDPEPNRIRILIAPEPILVRALPRRAHQGWRYLAADDAPPDLFGGEIAGVEAMPGALLAELSALALL
ncbi:DUF1489 family protein [Sphingomonas morindae]|uniref:DUF1489 domain-containing protein n=1 Tax=Sphingomonas morindae TaxID=1541170 RepID=A0ABY4XC04_9SPHN|nr:DUF1489 family protein [Sphingomonas morindae]USI74388.1 DUF1489 domain-containing protein [Sphingomonas morindae]